MEKSFKDVIEEIKVATLDPEETKKYILAIKGCVGRFVESVDEELDDRDLILEYLEEYEEDLKPRGNVQQIGKNMLMHNAFKRLLQDAKGNRANFNSVIKEAKRVESDNKNLNILIKRDLRDSMISAVRYIIRTKGVTKEADIIEAIRQEKAKVDKDLKNNMISIIQSSVGFLNDYGFLDEYINESNEELEQLGLNEFKYTKRNPIADVQYDEEGQEVKDVEDIGVLDSFSKENLEQLSVEDLLLMTTFWEAKYFQERIEISKAMSSIDALGLWGDVIHGDDATITSLDNKRVEAALRKDLAVTYLARSGCQPTPKIRRQYKKFLESERLSSGVELGNEVEAMMPEISNLEQTARDITTLECLIVYLLRNKDLKIKKWGIVDREETDGLDEEVEAVNIAIDNRNFRGPLVMGVPTSVLKEFLNEEDIEFPRYGKNIDTTYSNIMAKLYLPTNNYFSNLVKKAYKENPNSVVLADLAGKKVRDGEER